jgi:hypothetical protein
MTLQVTGPRAQRFVDVLSDYTGMTLNLADSVVSADEDEVVDPFESETLQYLVNEIIDSDNVVEIHAFGGRPAAGFFADSFLAAPAVQRPRRSVYLNDVLDVEKMSPTLARAIMGHILREYFGASRPPGHAPSANYIANHIPAIRTEAQIASDIEERPIWTGGHRPWEQMYGHINVRSYGPTMKYQLFFSPGWYLVSIKGP